MVQELNPDDFITSENATEVLLGIWRTLLSFLRSVNEQNMLPMEHLQP